MYVDPNNNPHKISTLLGITSLVAACGYPEYPDVFARVTRVLDWIESKTSKYVKTFVKPNFRVMLWFFISKQFLS